MRCPYDLCDGSGWLVDERTRSAAECRCMPELRAARVAGTLRARIPREYQDASFEHSNINGLPRQAVATVRRYVDTLDERLAEGDGLWMFGTVGAGKTWLAMLVARAAIEQGRGVAVYSVPRLLSEIRRTYDGDGTKTLDLLDQLTDVPLLVLDDIGTERSNPWVLEQLYTIINERWQERRSTIITTNLDLEPLREQIGERTVSRLTGMCELVELFTPDAVDHRYERHQPPTGHVGPLPADGHGAAPAAGLGAPPPFDPRGAEAWQPTPAATDPDAPGGGAGAAPPTFGADPRDLRRPERRVHGDGDGRRWS